MKIFIIIYCLVFFSIQITCKEKIQDSVLIKKSGLYIDYLQKQKWDDAYKMFDSTMHSVFQPEKIEITWSSIKKQLGELEKVICSEVLIVNDKKAVIVTCKFKVMYADIRCVYNQNEEIAGFFIAPNYKYSEYQTPKYADIKKFDDIKVKFGQKDWELDAVLSIPKKDTNNPTQLFPIVILVHGSGPNDMDESIGPNKPFKDLALGLASKGVAVFRYNKRTHQYPAKLIDYMDNFTVNEEVVDDVIEAINYVANTSDINPRRIFILGHSLGGMLIPKIALRDKALEGLIVLAGNARPLQELLVEQYNYIFKLDNDLSLDEKLFLDTLNILIANVNSPKLTKNTSINNLPLKLPAFYWMSLRDYKPAILAKKVKSKMFILQGERDYQVTLKDFELWKTELKDMNNVKFKSYPKLNHLFMEGEGICSPDEYLLRNHIPEYVIEDIANFIKSK